MISMKQTSEPFDIELPYGVTVTVKPLTTAGMAAAQAVARRRVEGVEAQYKELTEAGLSAEGLPDLANDGERDGLFQDLLIKELAIRHVTAWVGIEDDPPVTPENITAVMSLYPVGERFFHEFTLKQVLLTAAKHASGLSAAGTSSRVEGRNTAKPAPDRGTVKRTAAKSAPDASTP